MGNIALIIRVYKTGENTRNSVTNHMHSIRTVLSRCRCALGALWRATPLYMSLRRKLFFNSFRDEEKTLHDRISAYHRTCLFRTLFINNTFLYLLLTQYSPFHDITSYLPKTHSNIHSVYYKQGSGQCLVDTASMTDEIICTRNRSRKIRTE